jgi:acyl-CoA synthetase (AMP-forming)/AMP-acid ligase II
VVAAAAEAWPDAEAIVDGDVRISFAELHERVGQARGAAQAAGIRRGDRAAIWAPNRWEWIVAALGVQAAGGVVVPMTTRYKGEEAAYVLKRSGAKLLFTVQEFLGVDYPALLEGRETDLELTVLLDSSSWDAYMSCGGTRTPPAVSETDVADIIFTSGTTGRPKGVISSHAQTVGVPRAWAATVGLQAGDRYLLVSPFSHTSGYKCGFVGAIMTGATTYPLAVADTPALLDLVTRERITMLPGTPTLFQTILNHPERHRFELSSLRLSAVGAASVPVELVRRMKAELFDTVVTGYGLTETTGVATMSRFDDAPELIAHTVGRPLPGVEVRIVDPAGAEVATGAVGEVLVRGYNVMQGYFDAPEHTAEAIDADGWLHTGDVGRVDEAGYLSITDRLKDMYIVGGFNAYPAEIEATLLGHPGVALVAVIGIPDEHQGEVGMAFVVPRPGASPTEQEIIAWSRTEMANYKVPRRVAIVEELPLNAVGKVVKPELRTAATSYLGKDPALATVERHRAPGPARRPGPFPEHP